MSEETMGECCGKPMTTRFCPHCGRENCPEAGLWGLLKLCRTSAKALRSRAQSTAELGESDHHHSAWAREYSPEFAAKAAKWQAWADALEALLAAQPSDA
jgi:hypothetical protein